MMVTRQMISDTVQALGLSNKPVCLHASLSSFGFVAGGSEAVIESFLNQGSTVMVPTFSSAYAATPPPHLRPARNGCGDYSWLLNREKKRPDIYTHQSNEIDLDMGIIPRTVLAMKNRKRGDHPLNSFAAVGPLAETLIAEQGPCRVYAPLQKLVELEGMCVLMGVHLNRLTLIHLAEQLSGRTLFRRWARDAVGEVMMVEVGGCSEGFHRFQEIASSVSTHIEVGRSMWTVIRAADFVSSAAHAIAIDPKITHCGASDCDRCNDGIEKGPVF